MVYLLGFRVWEVDPILHVVPDPHEGCLSPQCLLPVRSCVQILEVLDGGYLPGVISRGPILSVRDGTRVWNGREDEVLEIVVACIIAGVECCIHCFSTLFYLVLLGDLLSSVKVWCMVCNGIEQRLPVIGDNENGRGPLHRRSTSVLRSLICQMCHLESCCHSGHVVTVSSDHLDALVTKCFGGSSRDVASNATNLVPWNTLEYRVDDGGALDRSACIR